MIQIGREAPQDGKTCCKQLFDAKPHLTQQGTCFATKSQFPISAGLTVTTQHEQVIMDSEIASQDMLSAQGIAFAVVDSSISPGAALRLDFGGRACLRFEIVDFQNAWSDDPARHFCYHWDITYKG